MEDAIRSIRRGPVAVLVAVGLTTATCLAGAACKGSGVTATVQAPETVQAGEPVMVTVKLRNDNDQGFDLRSNLTSEGIKPGELLGSVWATELDSAVALQNYTDQVARVSELRSHSEIVIGRAQQPLAFPKPGRYILHASFTRNEFTAVLQNMKDPSCRLVLDGFSSTLITVTPRPHRKN